MNFGAFAWRIWGWFFLILEMIKYENDHIPVSNRAKLPSHYFPISINQTAVFLNESWTANEI